MVLIFDSHPVQYKAPVYQRLQQLRPGSFKVIYATDASVRGHHDREFCKIVAWDQPLLDGYPHLVLNNERGTPLTGFRSLTGRGIRDLLQKERPDTVIISQFIYEFDFVTYLNCVRLNIPIWIRQETQDEAFVRPAWKQSLRGLFYRIAYRQVSHAFYFGELNREHLLLHGLAPERLTFAPYSSPVGANIDIPTRQRLRTTKRDELAIRPDEIVLLFSGKLIDKKNPHLILDALEHLTAGERNRFRLVFAGSGPLEPSLRVRAEKFPDRVHFAGFVNQSEIASWYFAADILLLPSRRAGETWGLVVNEALEAGCAVIMTKAVGCHPEFADWDRVRVIPDNDAAACANALRELAAYPRSFDWCAERMKVYSIEATAAAIARQFDVLNPAPVS
ncbi:MAG: glycosyltransferase family 4 protein [Methylacidiphilales bacterium]|nr:glycosyltransferase family 4 protein [Candidatus Methylacidiphilales bacterium]